MKLNFETNTGLQSQKEQVRTFKLYKFFINLILSRRKNLWLQYLRQSTHYLPEIINNLHVQRDKMMKIIHQNQR